jgi:ketosteroid isomerase-like protein
MKAKHHWLSALVLAVALYASGSPAHASQEDADAVRHAAEGFYSALNVLFTGDLSPMTEVWSRADDITYMGPDGGFQVGWRQILVSWKRQAAMKLGGRVEPDHMQITVGQELAVVENYEEGVNTNAAGKSQKVSIRATSVFRKEHGKWKMIAHHTDLLPYLK